MAHLLLIRHGQSQWNTVGKWTGWTDIDLDEKGIEEAKTAAQEIKNIPLDIAYTSPLIRAKHTLLEILEVLNKKDIPIIESDTLKEKNYGDFTGKNKWEVKESVGEEEFMKIRRSWDYRLPNGESLKDVYDRAVPYFQNSILPELKEGKNVIVTTHGNTLRALVKYLDAIPDENISDLEIATGEIYDYQIDSEGKIVSKRILAAHPNTV